MSSQTASDKLEPGRLLGQYEVQSKLGHEGMGQVYHALDTRLHRVVALKVLTGEAPGSELREAQGASALNHPNIVTIYEVGHILAFASSLSRLRGDAGFPGLAAAPGRLVFSFGELTGNIWLDRKQ